MGKKADALRAANARLTLDLEGCHATIAMLQKDMPVGEYVCRVALNSLWELLGAKDQTDAVTKLKWLLAGRDILNEIGEAVETRGFAHMTNGRDIGKLLDQLDCTERALKLAVAMLAPHEPGHSCAVSSEFVALAAVSTGDTSAQVMEIIDAPRDPASFNAVPVNLEVTVS
ncbi:MAG: hypothetical protein QHD01_05855 [Bradyrhizobium sp.]|uniref:hypothetical protein n=1 Tax=Bradyrhizobium sp. TaxID=376 RepID=UPI0029AFF0A7|nr:hypothetical protein [Bradyrhizobium sp.]MDX3966109.1 hypothetical protein [Bradyrhizobium sp.]